MWPIRTSLKGLPLCIINNANKDINVMWPIRTSIKGLSLYIINNANKDINAMWPIRTSPTGLSFYVIANVNRDTNAMSPIRTSIKGPSLYIITNVKKRYRFTAHVGNGLNYNRSPLCITCYILTSKGAKLHLFLIANFGYYCIYL